MSPARQYAAYRESGTPWLGRIPSDWGTLPLFAVLHESARANIGVHEKNLLSLSFGSIVRKNIEGTDGLIPGSYDTYQIVQPGDLVFRFTDLQNDQRSLRTALVRERGIITSAYAAASPCGIEPEYAAYLMRSYDTSKVFYGLGGGVRQSLNFSEIRRLPVLLPSLSEQRAIVNYLNYETATIDALVAKQVRLIDVLKDRRASVISHVIDCCGIRSVRLGLLLAGLKDGTHGSFARMESALGKPLLGARNVKSGRLVLDGAESHISDEDHARIVANGYPRKGDVLLVIVGATIGKSAVYDLQESHAFQRSVAFLRPRPVLDSYFLWYQVQSKQFRDELALRSKVSAQPGVYMGDVSAIPVVLTTLDEQRRAAKYLDEQTAKIDQLIAKAEQFITLARERRSALITAAVTGQIDVRAAS